MDNKFFGIAESGRTTTDGTGGDAIPSAKRATGFTREQPFYEYINQALFELKTDHIIGTAAQLAVGSCTCKYQSSDQTLRDSSGTEVTLTDGDRVYIIGLDTLTADFDLSAYDRLRVTVDPSISLGNGSQDLIFGDETVLDIHCDSATNLTYGTSCNGWVNYSLVTNGSLLSTSLVVTGSGTVAYFSDGTDSLSITPSSNSSISATQSLTLLPNASSVSNTISLQYRDTTAGSWRDALSVSNAAGLSDLVLMEDGGSVTSGGRIYAEGGITAEGTTSFSDGTDGISITPGATTTISGGSLQMYPKVDSSSTITIKYRDYGGSAWRSALSIANVASGYSALQLMLSGGNVGIGEAAPSHILHINGQGRSTSSAWATTSDKRVKENIVDHESALDKIMQLRPVRFNFKDEFMPDHEPSETGFIAQEFAEVVPEAVKIVKEIYGGTFDEETETYTDRVTIEDFNVLSTSCLLPMLVKAVQELNAKIGA